MRFLFLGDSITDAGSYRKPRAEFTGYVKFVADTLDSSHVCFNHGIRKNLTADVMARYDEDVKAVSPDFMVLLIGINDVYNTTPQDYEKRLTKLLEMTKADFPSIKIVVLEPFLLPEPDRISWFEELAKIRLAAKNAAKKSADAFIPLHSIFQEACKSAPWQDFSLDGVHPEEKGQKLIAEYVRGEIKRLANV